MCASLTVGVADVDANRTHAAVDGEGDVASAQLFNDGALSFSALFLLDALNKRLRRPLGQIAPLRPAP
jgi:hypothetical protein